MGQAIQTHRMKAEGGRTGLWDWRDLFQLDAGTYDVTFVLRADSPTPRPGWLRYRDGSALGGGLTGWAPEEYWARNMYEGWHTWPESNGEPEGMLEPESRAPREGWLVEYPDTGWWFSEKDAEKWAHLAMWKDWRTWLAKREAREGYEVQDPDSGTWFVEPYAYSFKLQGWELWKSRPIQEPEPEPEPKDEAPGLREAARVVMESCDDLSRDYNSGKSTRRCAEEMRDTLRTALSRAEEQDAKVEALVEAVGKVIRRWHTDPSIREMGNSLTILLAAYRDVLKEAPDA